LLSAVANPPAAKEFRITSGVQLTGRIITNAALLLAVVIGAFAISGLVFMKLIGWA
jgi:RND superfamily putative drug exporter